MPLAGHQVARFLRGGTDVGGATLTRFFGFHVAVLPGLTTLLLVVHLGLVQRHGMSSSLHKRYNSGADTTAKEKFLEPRGAEPVTELLLRWRAGDQECLHRLLPKVEGELRRIAHRYMRMERLGQRLG